MGGFAKSAVRARGGLPAGCSMALHKFHIATLRKTTYHGLRYPQMIPRTDFVRCCLRLALLLPFSIGMAASAHGASEPQVQETEGEIVANLAGGRVIVH